MKRLGSLLLLICFVLLPVLQETDAQTEVIVKLQQPPPNQLRSTDIWNLTLTNTTRNTLQISLFGTLEEAGAGVIVDGTSKPFTLQPGTKTITYDDVKSGKVNFKSGKWREAFTRTGNAPSGDYTICIYVKDKSGNEIGTDCIDQKIEISGAPQLVSPADGEEIAAGSLPNFTWLPPMPIPPGKTTYKLKIVEILGNQSPEIAFAQNRSFFEKDGIRMTTFSYPLKEKKFEEGKSYAWMISIGELKSDICVFKIIIDESNPGSCTALDTTKYKITCLGKLADGNYHYQVSDLVLNKVISNTDSWIESGESDGSPSPTNYIVPFGGNTITNISPASIIASTAQSFTISFELIAPSPVTNFTVTLYAYSYHLNAATNQKVYCDKNFVLTFDNVPDCECKECESVRVLFNDFTTTQSGGSGNLFNIAGNITSSVTLYGIEIEMQSYSYSAAPSACSNGVTSLEESGMFIIPGTTINGSPVQLFNEVASGSSSSNLNASKIIKLSSTSALNGNIPLNLLVGLPGPIPGLDKDCCKIRYQVCVKVRVFYDSKSCKSCTFVHCFDFNN